MEIISYILALVLTWANGYLLVKIIAGKENDQFYKGEYLLYSFLIGLIFITFILFITGRLGIYFSFTSIVILTVLSIATLAIITKYSKRKTSRLQLPRYSFKKQPIAIKIGIILFICLINIKIIFGGINIITVPTYHDDVYVNRNYRSKVFFQRESLVLDKKDPEYLGLGYRQYPLTPYLYKVYLTKWAGERKDSYANFPSLLFYLCGLGLIFFFLVKETKNINRGILGVRALSSIPLYYIHGTSPYLDVFVSIYVFIAMTMLYRYQEKKISIRYPIIFIGVLGYTKSEGLLVFTTGILISYLLWTLLQHSKLGKKQIKEFLTITVGSIIINLPFILFKRQQGLGFGNGNIEVSKVNFEFHKEIFIDVYKSFFETGSYNLLFFSFIVIVGFNILSKSYTKRSLWFILGLLICFIIIMGIYSCTFAYQYVLDQTGLNRSMIQLMPLFITTIILSCHDIYERYHK